VKEQLIINLVNAKLAGHQIAVQRSAHLPRTVVTSMRMLCSEITECSTKDSYAGNRWFIDGEEA